MSVTQTQQVMTNAQKTPSERQANAAEPTTGDLKVTVNGQEYVMSSQAPAKCQLIIGNGQVKLPIQVPHTGEVRITIAFEAHK